MGIKRTISKKYIAENPISKVREDIVEYDDGTQARWIVLETTPGSMVFAITDDNEVLLVKNYCYARQESLFELPAGYMNKDESPEDAAKRELLEETGYMADVIESLGKLYVKPTKTNKVAYPFLARKARKVQEMNPDAGENITVHKVKLDKLQEMLDNGEIKSVDSVATILLALRRLNVSKHD